MLITKIGAGYLVAVISMFFLFIPTSVNGNISTSLSAVTYLVYAVTIFIIMSSYGVILFNFCALVFMLICLLTYTLVWAGEGLDIAVGALIPYMAMTLLLSCDFSKIKNDLPTLPIAFLLAFLLFLSYGILLDLESIIWVVGTFYQQYYPELFEQSVMWHNKPVSVFSAHSVAAFSYFYIFIFLELYSKSVEGKKYFVVKVIAIAFVFLLPFLKSFSAISLFAICIVYLFLGTLKSRFRYLAILLSLFLFYYFIDHINKIDIAPILDLLLSADNGLFGRYSGVTRLTGTYDFIILNPLLPIGLAKDFGIAFGDSFLAEYVIRVGFFCYILILACLYVFLFRALKSHFYSFIFFFFFIVADLGYPLLVTYKFMVLFIFMLIVLNSREQKLVES